MTFTFKKAVRSASKLRLALSGTSGSGKTYGALLLAKGIGGKIAVIEGVEKLTGARIQSDTRKPSRRPRTQATTFSSSTR